VDVVSLGDAVDDRSVAEGMAVAGTSLVDVVLEDGGVEHGHGGDKEAECDTGDGAEGDVVFLEHGIDEAVEDGREEENGDGVEVLHQVVGDTVTSHLTGLGDEVA
jgi:hypothetical protein